jgi:hypothetical protein
MRLEVAIIERDGTAQIVNAARPATLVAFTDEFDKTMPETIREIAWVVHHALAIEQPLDTWLATLEDISALPDDVALARRIIGGDDEARQIALGEIENPNPPDIEGVMHDEAGENGGRPFDPALEQLTAATETPGARQSQP